MKTKYFLSALAISTAFVSCNQDEQTFVNAPVNTNGEIVGEMLLGTGLSINLCESEGSETRATADGWENGDKAGLGWVIEGTDPTVSQANAVLKNVEDVLYANHFYTYEGTWNTRSNIYRGWHFAYYPFAAQTKPNVLTFQNFNSGDAMFNTENAIDGDWEADIINNAPHISAAAFLKHGTDGNVNVKEGTITEIFTPMRVVNVILPYLIPSVEFTESDALNNISINSIELDLGANIVTKKLTVHPSKLASNQYDENNKYDSDMTKKALIASLDEALEKTGSYGNVVTTELEEGMFKLGQNHMLRMFVAPSKKESSAQPTTKYRINVDGGYFEIDKDDAVGANQTAVSRTRKLFTSTGWNGGNNRVISFQKMSYDGETLNPAQKIDLYLTPQNFHPEFKLRNAEDWDKYVSMAQALGVPAEFEIATEDGVYELEKISAPTSGVKIYGENGKKATLKITGETTWSSDIEIDENVTVVVGDGAVLTVAAGDESFKTIALVNEGDIIAERKAVIGDVTAQNFNNDKGTVTIAYGAFIYPATDKEGTIAYKLRATDGAWQVNTLLALEQTVGQEGTANVNKFIVEDIEWNLDVPFEGKDNDNDDYHASNGIDGSKYNFEKLALVDIEIISTENNVAKVVADVEAATFANVTMSGANASLEDNITVTGNVEVIGGGKVDVKELNTITSDGSVEATTIGSVSAAATVQATNVTGNIVATGDVTVGETIDGDVNTTGAVSARTINGSVEANSVEANKIETVGGSVKANTIKVTESISANVEATDNVTVPEITGHVTLKDNALTFDCANVNGNVTVEGATVTSVATNVTGTLTVVGTYNMQSAPKASPATLTIGNIVVGNENKTKSALNVNQYNTVETVNVMVNSNATLDASKNGSAVWYSGTYKSPGTSKNVNHVSQK